MARMSPGHGTKLRLIPCFDETTARSASTCARMSTGVRENGGWMECSCIAAGSYTGRVRHARNVQLKMLTSYVRYFGGHAGRKRNGGMVQSQGPQSRDVMNPQCWRREWPLMPQPQKMCAAASHFGSVSQYTPFTVSHSLFFKFPKGHMEARIITNFSVFCGVVAEIISCDVLDLVVRVVNLTQGT